MAVLKYNVIRNGVDIFLRPEVVQLDAGDTIDFGHSGKTSFPIALNDPDGNLAVTLRRTLARPVLKAVQKNGMFEVSISGSAAIGSGGPGEGIGSGGPGEGIGSGGPGEGIGSGGPGEGIGSGGVNAGILGALYATRSLYIADDHYFLALKMPTQKPHLNWCWAATAAAVENYVNPTRRATPCRIASTYLNVSNCCSAPAPCDQPAALALVLEQFQLLGLSGVQPRRATIDEIRKAIVVDQMPVCVRIEWDANGRGHFVTIVGFSGMKGNEVIDIKDPFFGSSSIQLNAFPEQYESGASWTHTMFTEK